jgi:hypothetical protein
VWEQRYQQLEQQGEYPILKDTETATSSSRRTCEGYTGLAVAAREAAAAENQNVRARCNKRLAGRASCIGTT